MKWCMTLLLFIIIATVSYAESPILVPDGYELQRLEVTEGSIAKPKKWFYAYSSNQQGITWTISKEDSKLGRYETGMRIQFFPWVSKVVQTSPQAIAQQIISQKKQSSQEIFRECSPVSEGDFIRVCLETLENIESTSGKAFYHILYSVFWSNEKDTFVLTTFGTPATEWEKMRPIVDVMANFELIGKDFWKTQPTNK